MSEEQACLVRTRSDSESSSKLGSFGSIARNMTYMEGKLTEGSGEPGSTVAANQNTGAPEAGALNQDANDSGELIDYNDSSVLVQFHEDALRQAGCGLSQFRVLLATGLAMSGAVLELAVIPFVLPSAEIELCILEHEKSWLVMISLVGVCLGSIGWGNLADRLGRRRALASCLCVNIVFASIAAFMPTYGTLMMARLCSAIGSGGIAPAAFAYAAELCPRGCRARALATLVVFAGLGALYASAVARAVVPATGTETLIENKEHFSAWHRYLLLCTLPILAALVSLIWTPESPRYLLEVGREVDAMMVYQSIHAGNQIRVCGKGSGAGNGNGNNASGNNGSGYRLGELELPGKRRPLALHHVRHSVKMFWQAFFQLFSSVYRRTTLTLGGTLFLSMVLYYGLSAYVPALVVQREHEEFEASKKIIENETYYDVHYNRSLQNLVYVNTTFSNSSYRDMFMCHVSFKNCTFRNVTFANIKTSYVLFMGSTLFNSSIIDTDIIIERDMDAWCVLNGSIVRGMRPVCARRADLTSRLDGLLAEQTMSAAAILAASPLAAAPYKTRPLLILCVLCALCSPALALLAEEKALYAIEAVYRFLLTLVYFGISVMLVESYPANLRCTAYGLIMSAVYVGAAVARTTFEALAIHAPIGGALLAGGLAAAAACVSRLVSHTELHLL